MKKGNTVLIFRMFYKKMNGRKWKASKTMSTVLMLLRAKYHIKFINPLMIVHQNYIFNKPIYLNMTSCRLCIHIKMIVSSNSY